MSFSLSDISEVWGPPYAYTEVSHDRLRQYNGIVPGFLLDAWREFGFSGFQNGLFWLCDPVAWQPVVDEWTTGITLPSGTDEWIAVSRTAFGEMSLWGRRTGMSLTVVPYRGWIAIEDCSDEMASRFDQDNQVYASLVMLDRDSADVDGDDGKPLFDRLLRDLGPVDADTVYGFVPALALGGAILPKHAQILDAAVHMRLLSDVTPRTMLADNPYL